MKIEFSPYQFADWKSCSFKSKFYNGFWRVTFHNMRQKLCLIEVSVLNSWLSVKRNFAFISVIYINSVSSNSLVDSMRSFRKSKAANPQINAKLTRNPPEEAWGERERLYQHLNVR